MNTVVFGQPGLLRLVLKVPHQRRGIQKINRCNAQSRRTRGSHRIQSNNPPLAKRYPKRDTPRRCKTNLVFHREKARLAGVGGVVWLVVGIQEERSVRKRRNKQTSAAY